MLGNYQAKELHVATRREFPKALIPELIDGRFSDWKSHPQFIMSGATLHGFHNRLRNACETLTHKIGEAIHNFDSDATIHWRLLDFGKQIIGVAHSHHHAEDTVYFPQYKALFPQLNRPLRLLDSDHRVLEQALDNLETALDGLNDKSSIGNWECARDQAETLTRIIHRHLDDEEEIVMPAIMKRDS